MKIIQIMIATVVVVIFADASQQKITPYLSHGVEEFVAYEAKKILDMASKGDINLASGLAAIFTELSKREKIPELDPKLKESILIYANICWQTICRHNKEGMNEVIQKRIAKAKDFDTATYEQNQDRKPSVQHYEAIVFEAKKDLDLEVNYILKNLLERHCPDLKFPSNPTSIDEYNYCMLQLNKTVDPEKYALFVTGELIAKGFLNEYLKTKVRKSLLS